MEKIREKQKITEHRNRNLREDRQLPVYRVDNTPNDLTVSFHKESEMFTTIS